MPSMREPILDGNVKRVLARLLAHPHAHNTALFWRWSESLLDQQQPRDFNQALMDLGQRFAPRGSRRVRPSLAR